MQITLKLSLAAESLRGATSDVNGNAGSAETGKNQKQVEEIGSNFVLMGTKLPSDVAESGGRGGGK